MESFDDIIQIPPLAGSLIGLVLVLLACEASIITFIKYREYYVPSYSDLMRRCVLRLGIYAVTCTVVCTEILLFAPVELRLRILLFAIAFTLVLVLGDLWICALRDLAALPNSTRERRVARRYVNVMFSICAVCIAYLNLDVWLELSFLGLWQSWFLYGFWIAVVVGHVGLWHSATIRDSEITETLQQKLDMCR